ncbi:MAG: hypothetical protein AAGI72_17095 [Pseudomonadota bacterium]
MGISIGVQIKPFRVPNAVIDAEKDETTYPLSALSSEVLERLCEQFTREVFEKAGKRRLPQEACGCD